MAISINELLKVATTIKESLNGENPNNWAFLYKTCPSTHEHLLILCRENDFIEVLRGSLDYKDDAELLNSLLGLDK